MKTYLLQITLFFLVLSANQSFSFKVHIVTWNVNEKKPPEGLKDLLSTNLGEADIYAIGLQEVDNTLKPGTSNGDKWLEAIRDVLLQESCMEVGKVSIKGSMLMVFAKISVATKFTGVETDSVKTGFWRVGNKGGTALRFNFEGTSYCFVNSHLAAHDDQYAKRVQDYTKINRKLSFNRKSVEEHDLVFWFGDLNFRLDVSENEVRTALNRNLNDSTLARTLLKHDQLKKAISNKEAFVEYEEEEPSFYPTYKFHIGSNNLNWKRKPAWPDRILYKVRSVYLVKVQTVKYTSLMQYKISDHKPVVADFEVSVPKVE